MRLGPTCTATLVAVAALGVAPEAAADTLTIRRPGAHPRYALEAEPHVLLGVFNAPGPADETGLGFGGRLTIEVVDNGFVSSINNTVGVGIGADFVHWGKFEDPKGQCVREVQDGRNLVCVEREERTFTYVWLPVVMQWNFWLSRDWSVFGEPGLAVRLRNPGGAAFDPFVFYAGGRWHFARGISLTMRLGIPTVSAGVSFLL